MPIIDNLLKKYEKLQMILKVSLVILAICLLFYWVNLFSTLHNKSEDAYSVLLKENQKLKLQDTRIHNWSEVNSKQ